MLGFFLSFFSPRLFMTSPEPSANLSTGACAQYRTCARSSSTLALTCPRTPAQLIGWPERAASFRPAKTTWRCSRTAERSRSGTFERRVWGTRRFHGAKHFPPFSREFCSIVSSDAHILLTANMFHTLQSHRFRTYQFQVPLVHFYGQNVILSLSNYVPVTKIWLNHNW